MHVTVFKITLIVVIVPSTWKPYTAWTSWLLNYNLSTTNSATYQIGSATTHRHGTWATWRLRLRTTQRRNGNSTFKTQRHGDADTAADPYFVEVSFRWMVLLPNRGQNRADAVLLTNDKLEKATKYTV